MNRAKTWTNFLCFQLIRFFDLHTFFKWTNEIKFSWAVDLQKNTHHTLGISETQKTKEKIFNIKWILMKYLRRWDPLVYIRR